MSQDVATKIMQFAQHGPRAMCVLSANGAISNVTLRQQLSSGGTVTYEVCIQLIATLSQVKILCHGLLLILVDFLCLTMEIRR